MGVPSGDGQEVQRASGGHPSSGAPPLRLGDGEKRQVGAKAAAGLRWLHILQQIAVGMNVELMFQRNAVPSRDFGITNGCSYIQ